MKYLVLIVFFTLLAPTSIFANSDNSIFDNSNLPPASKDQSINLSFKIISLPSDKKLDKSLQLQLEKNDKTIQHSSFFITVTKENDTVLRELFHTHTGLLTIQINQSKNMTQWMPNGELEPFQGGWTTANDQIGVNTPLLQKGSYHLKIEVFGVYNDWNIFVPDDDDEPKYDSWFNVNDKGIISSGAAILHQSRDNTRIISPLTQKNLGIEVTKIKCNDGLLLLLKSSGNSPACVTPETAIKLIERRWAINNQDTINLGPTDLDIVREKTIFLRNGIDDYDSGTSFNPIYVKSILGVDNKITWFNAKQEPVQLQSDENYFNVTIAPREKFTFEFDTVGAHKYHDSTNWKRGTVFVSTNEIESSNLKPAKLLREKDYEITKTIVTAALSDDIITKKRLDDTMLSAYVTQRGGDVMVPKSLGILCTLSNCDTINYRFGITKPLYYPKNANDALNFTKNFMEKIGYTMDGTEWIDTVDLGSYMTVTIQQKVQGWIIPNQMVHFIFYRDNTTFALGRWYEGIAGYQFKVGQDDAKTIAKEFMQKEMQKNPELNKFQYKMQEIGETRVIIFDDKPAYVIPVSFKSTLEQQFVNEHCGYPEYFTQLVMIEGVTGAVLGLDLPGCE